MEPKIVALDKHSKVIYALHNIFTPFMLFIIIVANIVEDFSSETGLSTLAIGFIIFGILALYLLINGICSYSKFVQIDEKYLYVCKKRSGGIQVLNKIDRDFIQEVKCAGAHSVKLTTKDGKVIRLLSCTPSITLMVLTAPIFCLPFVLKGNAVRNILNTQINELLGTADEQMKTASRSFQNQMTGIDVFCWIFLVLFILLGLLGIVLGFCAFMYCFLGMLIAFLTSLAGE